jgi:hypothetical protein
MQKGPMRFLLDDDLLSGAHDVATLFRPQRAVRRVDAGHGAAVAQMMTYLCQVWGGHAHPIIPVTGPAVPEPYLRCLHGEQYDIVDRGNQGEPGLDLPEQIRQERAWDHPAAVVAAHVRRELIQTIEVAELDPADPWAPIYAATLGFLPRQLDDDLRKQAGLREGISFADMIPVRYVQVNGSLQDLVSRLGKDDVLSPRTLASVSLATGLGPDTSFLGGPPLLPSPGNERRAAGPNIIVVVSEGSAADLALLWNLRGAHGDRRALPIGLPADQVTDAALAALQQPGVATMFGLSGGACRLTSVSVPVSELDELAADTPTVVVPYEDLLTFGPAPGRPHSQVATFAAGASYLEAVTESDRDVLAVSMQMPFQPRMVLDVRIADAPLPTDLTMRGGRAFGPSFQAGAAQVRVDLSSLGSARVQWPSSWTSLAAVARTRGLRVSPSPSGQAAATLIRALGSVDAIRWLAHRPLITLPYRLAERSGMSWQKNQLNSLRGRLAKEGRPTDILDETESALSAPEHAVTPAGEGRALGFEDFRKALAGRTAAARWVTWAERHHLLVRGVNIPCPHCQAASWLPMASMPPPVGCPGCGRSLDTPYDPRHVPFAYRIGEPLRRVLETDSLGHVLTLNWFTRLFGDTGGLIGAHPGVNFYPGDGKDAIGEADVLLMFADGRLVPVEVKRTAAGVDVRALELMDQLAAALHAPYDVVALTQSARDCPGLPESIGQPTSRPRLLISEDQILNRRPFWAVGTDPFAWVPRTEQEDRERDAGFAAELEASDPDQPWDLVRDTLLGEH